MIGGEKGGMTTSDTHIKMFPGAAAACALPMLMGLVGGFMHISSARRLDWIMTLPLSFCFLFGTPIAAWLACRHLRKAEDPEDISRWLACFGAGFLGASIVHFSTALLQVIIIGFGTSLGPLEFLTILCAAAMIQLVLWLVITLPFTLLCATIFWWVTKFPSDMDAFE